MTLKPKLLLVLLLSGITLMMTFTSAKKNDDTVVAKTTKYYFQYLDSLQQSVVRLKSKVATASSDQLKLDFENSRRLYKQIEFLVDYYFQESGLAINGPNLPEAEPSEPEDIKYPTGFQVLEEAIYTEDPLDRHQINFDTDGLLAAVNMLKSQNDLFEPEQNEILDALKLNIYRLISKGLSGFDSPVAQNSITEAKHTLDALLVILDYFPKSQNIQGAAQNAVQFLEKDQSNFETFNRAVFIADYLNPICNEIYNYQKQNKLPFVKTPPRAIRSDVPNLFSKNAFDLMFYAPSYGIAPTDKTIALGETLFNDAALSANGNRSCATCHIPNKAFTDGLPLNESLDGGRKLLRNTPSLINAALQPVQFSDSRTAFLEEQAHDVISNPLEMGGVLDKILDKMGQDPAYQKAFAAAFADQKVNAHNLKTALAAYSRSLTALNSPFDQYMRGNKAAMNAEEIQGFNLFMGKAKCGTCHFVPTFNGTVPPFFEKMESEVLGIPTTEDTVLAKMDMDSGKYHLYRIPHHLFSFKTTTVRNAAVTAPYMHNGVFRTIKSLIDFYDRGGGAGLGFDLPNQTLPPDRLNLTQKEKKSLEAFIGTLTDTTSFKPNLN